MKFCYFFVFGLFLLGFVVFVVELGVKFEILQFKMVEYYKFYVVMWLEKLDQSFVVNLVVFYDLKKKDNGGIKWLKDMWQWWCKSGCDLQMLVDGVIGVMCVFGEYGFVYVLGKVLLVELLVGEYQFVVEVLCEVGGWEVVKVLFVWLFKLVQIVLVQGKEELGNVFV